MNLHTSVFNNQIGAGTIGIFAGMFGYAAGVSFIKQGKENIQFNIDLQASPQQAVKYGKQAKQFIQAISLKEDVLPGFLNVGKKLIKVKELDRTALSNVKNLASSYFFTAKEKIGKMDWKKNLKGISQIALGTLIAGGSIYLSLKSLAFCASVATNSLLAIPPFVLIPSTVALLTVIAV